MHGDHDPIGRAEGVDGEQAEGRRRIDDDVVEVVDDGGEGFLEAGLAADLVGQLDFSPRKVDVAGQEPEVLGGQGRWRSAFFVAKHPRVPHGRRQVFGTDEVLLHEGELFAKVVGQQIVGRLLDAFLFDAEGRGAVPLWIQVDEQDLRRWQAHFLMPTSKGCSEVDRRGGFCATALLVGDRDDHLVGVHAFTPETGNFGSPLSTPASIRIKRAERRARGLRSRSCERCDRR